ncbi:MAG: hypothetical protein L0H26_00240 [Microlunatus sp.]|nr:hypothetical protein [Microlunatus sp.]
MTQAQALLTPYDTGDRLEPRPWVQGGLNAAQLVRLSVGSPAPTFEDFGRVDFDDDENRTVLTVYVDRNAHGYVLHIEDLTEEALTVTGGTEAAVIGLEHSPGVEELLSLAERGREDFLYQASHGDYDDQDHADAATRWAAAERAATVIRARLH